MKILVVDDNPTNIKVVSGFLHKWGHDIIKSHNGLDAIEKFKAEKPDLILMDIVMPKMNGKQAAAAIKKLVKNGYIPIIFITALKTELNIIDALKSGGDDYISKPFDKDLLFSKINVHQRIVNLYAELNKKNTNLLAYNRKIKHEQELVGHFFNWGQKMCDLDPDYINYYTSPISAYNGDIFLVKRRPSGGLYILVGDFTGHGLTAAIGTLPVTEIFFRLVEKNVSIVDISREINNKLYQILPVEIFFCATLMEIDQYAKSLSVWSGGLPESYIIDRKNNELITIGTDHMPLGIIGDSKFNSSIKTYSVNPGMNVYCSTDGVIESLNENDEIYGEQRLKKILIEETDNTINLILDDVKNFTNGKKQNDDTTIIEVTLKRLDDIDIIPSLNVTKAANVLPFSLIFKFEIEELRKQNSLIQIADMLGGNAELRPHKTFLYTIITELFINALEHGILKLESTDKLNPSAFDSYYKNKTEALQKLNEAQININISMPSKCNQVFISVSHSGKGGKFKKYSTNNAQEQLYGRGLNIVKSLCHQYSYHENGKQVDVIYLL